MIYGNMKVAKIATVFFILSIMLSFLIPPTGLAKMPSRFLIGLRSGISISNGQKVFEQWGVFSYFGLPWWHQYERFLLEFKGIGALSILKDREQTGIISSAGPAVVLTHLKTGTSLILDVRPAILSKSSYPDKNLGGKLQFALHVGVNVSIGWGLKVGYGFQHISNAGIYKRNPGLNIHTVEVAYQFE